jgi:hypothetical protein
MQCYHCGRKGHVKSDCNWAIKSKDHDKKDYEMCQ